MNASMEILLNHLDKQAWNDFARKQIHSHFWHSWEWGEFLASFRRRAILRFSVHDTQGNVLGLSSVCVELLPLLGKWGNTRGDSIPVYHFSGPILEDNLTLQSRSKLYEELIDFMDRELRKRRALHFTTRIWDPFFGPSVFEPWTRAGFQIREHRTFTYRVPQEIAKVNDGYTHSFKWAVKAGSHRGGAVEVNSTVDPTKIYELYSMSMAEGGTCPRYSLEEVTHALNWSSDLKDLYVCKYNGKQIGFALVLKFGRMNIYWLAGMNRNFRRINPTNLIINELICESVRNRILNIDFGGGRTSGLLHFKASLGARPEPTFELSKTYCNNPFLKLALKVALRLPGARDMIRRCTTKLIRG